jgi:hypothetical protein
MYGIDALFAHKLKSLIESRKAEFVEAVVLGRGIEDLSDYKGTIGRIAALDEVLCMFSLVSEEIRQESEGKRHQ